MICCCPGLWPTSPNPWADPGLNHLEGRLCNFKFSIVTILVNRIMMDSLFTHSVKHYILYEMD